MKITRSRAYTVNMGNFESFRTEASVELDQSDYETEDGAVPDAEGLYAKADAILAKALARDIREAAEVTNIANSFILTMEL